VIRLGDGGRDHGRSGGPFLALVHLRAGSLRVGVGDAVRIGQPLAECGNSGNSTQPHLHLQVMDSADLSVARGLPMAFRRYREWARGGRSPEVRHSGIPADAAIVEALD
jgi:murein DD-endopeptidase MepM/ murein hydrolase activator NlpD